MKEIFADLNLTTPALLFPAISLLLLAYTNRFLAVAALIRKLHEDYKQDPKAIIWGQIKNLRLRVNLIRIMQALGVSSLLFCVLTMFLIFTGQTLASFYVFGMSLILLIVSLGFSVLEIQMSVKALNIQLSELEDLNPEK